MACFLWKAESGGNSIYGINFPVHLPGKYQGGQRSLVGYKSVGSQGIVTTGATHLLSLLDTKELYILGY